MKECFFAGTVFAIFVGIFALNISINKIIERVEVRASAQSWVEVSKLLTVQLQDICLDHAEHSSCVWLAEFQERG